jgi:hypothetical protein
VPPDDPSDPGPGPTPDNPPPPDKHDHVKLPPGVKPPQDQMPGPDAPGAPGPPGP